MLLFKFFCLDFKDNKYTNGHHSIFNIPNMLSKSKLFKGNFAAFFQMVPVGFCYIIGHCSITITFAYNLISLFYIPPTFIAEFRLINLKRNRALSLARIFILSAIANHITIFPLINFIIILILIYWHPYFINSYIVMNFSFDFNIICIF